MGKVMLELVELSIHFVNKGKIILIEGYFLNTSIRNNMEVI